MRPTISADNQHPLSDLNGLRKYIFTSNNEGGEDFFLRVVTSGEEMRKNIKKPLNYLAPSDMKISKI